MKLLHSFTNPYRWLGAIAAVATLTGCNNGFVYEDLAECVPDRRIRLSYTRNMAFDEKREAEVTHAKVFAFTNDGALADFSVAEENYLRQNDYSVQMTLERATPYRFITWCGTDQNAFNINADPTEENVRSRAEGDLDSNGSELMEGLGATLENHNGVIDTKLNPIHYGNGEYQFDKLQGNDEYTINLTKDTNVIRVFLRKVTVAKNMEVTIIDKNDELDFNNKIANEDVLVTYYPCDIEENVVMAGQLDADGNEMETVRGSIYTFHTSRLFDPVENGVSDENLARIVIKEKKDDGRVLTIVDEPLVKDMLIPSKPKTIAPDGESWVTTKSDQEYLDREDTYDAIFTLEDYAHIVVHINGWRVVIQNVQFGEKN